jgi:PAS domain S-box-containing protein
VEIVMSPRPVVNKKRDSDKSREELIDELESLRGLNARLKGVVARCEKVTEKKDIYKSILEQGTGKECIESLCNELQEKQKEIELRAEELAVKNEEMRVQHEEFLAMDEIITRDKDIARINAVLRESEEKLRSYYDLPLIGMALTSPEKGWILANDEICRILGYSREDLFRTTWDQVTHPDDLDSDIENFNRLISGEIDNYTIEKRFVRKGGENVSTEISIGCVRNPEKSVRYIVGLMRDITERKQAEEALRRSETGLKKSQEIAHLGSWELDLVNNRLSWSDEVYRIFGLQPQEFGANYEAFLEAVHPDDRAAVDAAYSGSIREGRDTFEIEHRVVRKSNGEVRFVQEKCEHFRDDSGRITRSVGIVHDITERKHAEEALRESKDHLADNLAAMTLLHRVSTRYVHNGDLNSLLWDIVEAAIAIAGTDMGNIQLVDPASGALKIVAQRGFKQPFLDFFASVSHDVPTTCGAAFQCIERKVIDDVPGSPALAGTPELEALLAAGVQSVQSTPLINRRGEVIGMLSTHWRKPHSPDERILSFMDMLARQAADVIERKRVEDELKAAKAQAELYLDLMGHDISNMHQIALGYLEMAREIPADESGSEFLDKPIEVLQRSARLIRNVRKLQTLCDESLQTESVDICRILMDVQREFGAVPRKAITLNLNGHVHCFVRANEMLYDVFANLVSNAIKHTGDMADITIDLDVLRIGKVRYCRVMVEDDGPGIPDDFKGRIFNRILKGTDKAKGMGLGLYLVKSLVESYGGKVWVGDRVFGDHTKGARFVVMLPAGD